MGTTLSGTNASMPFAGLRKEMRRNRNIKVGKYWKIQSSFKYAVSMGVWAISIFFSSTIYRQKYIANFDIAILFLHSCMIALEPTTTGMYPSTSVTINCKFICRPCMYFWSSLLLFLTSKNSKDCSVFVSMEFLTWLTMSIYLLSWYIFIHDSPICR